MELLKKGDPRRKWRTFKRQVVFVTRDIVAAAAVTVLWYVAWSHGYHFADNDNDILIGAVITSFGVFWGVEASGAKGDAKEKYDKVVTSIFEKNKRMYLRYRDERPPIAVHVTIALIAIPFVSMIGLIAYHDIWMGAAAIFSVVMVMTGYWQTIILLENPTKSAWVRERTPEDWKTADVDEFFGFGKKAPSRPSPDSNFWH